MAKINPFRPHSPINPGMFVGRLAEIRAVERQLLQTRAGNSCSFMLTGERGIGKTSLLSYIRATAEGLIDIDGESVKFLVLDTDIEPTTTQLGFIRKLELAIRQKLARNEKVRTFLADAWQFLKRIEAAGVRVESAEPKPDDIIFEEFSYDLAALVNRLCSPTEGPQYFDARYDGVLLLVDEADNASASLSLGSFLKLLLERLQKRGCARVMVGIAGLPDVKSVLHASHPSSLRLFQDLVLDRLSTDEVRRVLRMCLKQANQENERGYTMTDEAESVLVGFSEGYPHFIQQFGYCTFEADTDGVIGTDDVTNGAVGETGAIALIGEQYYRNDFYSKIRTESYRQVLRIMADRLDGWITREEIRKRFKGSKAVLSNAIKALRDRHIILSKEGTVGVYRLQHKGFAYWIKLYTTDPNALQKTIADQASEHK